LSKHQKILKIKNVLLSKILKKSLKNIVDFPAYFYQNGLILVCKKIITSYFHTTKEIF